MTTFFTSDMHFGHKNIIEYCNRPFADTDEMDRRLFQNWNDTVGPDDHVWVLGDVAMGDWRKGLAMLMFANGHKHLVCGNHDRVWGHTRKITKEALELYSSVFETITDGALICLDNGRLVQVSHFPFEGDSQEEDRYTEARPRDMGLPLLHGHVHDGYKTGTSPSGQPTLNIGVDVWGMVPVDSSTVNAWLSVVPEISLEKE